ncbi:hypothetical protein V1277_001424 [Bradyrhizobium sp. AZCC 1588]|uniref:hypothetical protein n=1 Tax=Bradyrhizobium sp. AZCC 1588 TaxID=3117018 RepID=UPI002FEED5DF
MQRAFVRLRIPYVTRHFRRIIPVWEADFLQLAGEETIVVACDVGIEPVQTVFLEQMRLPQIADVIIDTAAFAPARNGPDVASQHRQEANGAKQL